MKKKVMFLVNHEVVIYNFRLELVERLIEEGYEVWISSPNGKKIEYLQELGCHFIETNISRHGMNLVEEAKLVLHYISILKRIKPDMVFSYTIKPNIYGAMACRLLKIPCVANITGLGTAVENGGFSQKVTVLLYKIAFKNIQKVFFQNEENMKFFLDKKLVKANYDLLPGSGVNLHRFPLLDYPSDKVIEFAFIARIMKEKGIDYYLEVARTIRKKYPNTIFHVCGFCEPEYNGKLQEYIDDHSVIYHGMVDDIREIHKRVHCVVHPTYYPEGISNVLLEACSSGRPIITTDRSGCREVVDDNINGYMIPQRDYGALLNAIESFLIISNEDRKKMGINGRKKIEKFFNREIVVKKYCVEIEINF
ncbi:glycosyltransferase family 4 protein [Enterococcus cecorum]|uniref:glycosyltransferase family 4 protein n=1 Tax=Enterococcus cecorum TaxID=44008 RepID=UPI00249138B4|nr:glycosyltransferase family 4 protein [Enterococcus cecorum]CAI3447006.1 glycosyltransferase family 4 protein [Enterococcus cecorum]